MELDHLDRLRVCRVLNSGLFFLLRIWERQTYNDYIHESKSSILVTYTRKITIWTRVHIPNKMFILDRVRSQHPKRTDRSM